MLENSLILSLSRNFWDGTWRSRHQVMSRLAVYNTVVFASPPLPFKDVLPWSKAKSEVRKPGLHQVNENLYAYIPPAYLSQNYRFPWIEQMLQAARIRHLKRLSRKWNNLFSVLYLWHPRFESYIDHFRDSIVCYHLHDELSAYDKQSMDGQDALNVSTRRIISRVDLTFTASESLYQRYKEYGDVYWIPNGVDYAVYEKACADNVPLPAEFRNIPRPAIGYMGTLRAQIDLQLLVELAEGRPDWSLVFVGDASLSTTRSQVYRALMHKKNVYMLGPKPVDLIPHYLRGLDVGLMCYRTDSAAHYCYPLKMHEYLAVGLPVVASPIPAVKEFKSVIRIASSTAEWIQAIEQSLIAKSPDEVAQRKRVASQNTWDQRVQVISEHIEAKRRQRQSGAHNYRQTPRDLAQVISD